MNKEKYIDESWKEQASQEKDVLAKESQQQAGQKIPGDDKTTGQSQGGQESVGQAQTLEINFLNYITSLGFQAMIFMGEVPNPATNEIDKNLDQAKFLIDTLSMLGEKTAGNLNDQEKNLLENTIYELQMKYVQISGVEEPTEEKKT